MGPVIHYPKFAREKQNGVILDAFSTVMDICPTVLELAGVAHPARKGKAGMFRGREVAPMRGKSWVSNYSELLDYKEPTPAA